MKLKNNDNEIDFEKIILDSYIDIFAQKNNELKNKIKGDEEFNNKLYEALSKKVNFVVNKENIDIVTLPIETWGTIYDEIVHKEKCLIKPSHYLLPYSLISHQPELEKYIPVQEPKNALELLSDRSTSRAFEILKEYTSDNTHRAHMGDLIYWQAWLSALGFTFNEPITEKDVITFIVQHAEGIESSIDHALVNQNYKSKLGPHKMATIKRRVASLSIFLTSAQWDNPCQTPEVKKLIAKLTKKYGSSKPAGKAITKDILDEMIDTCKDSLIDYRDKALLLFAWGSGGRRRSEVIMADMKNLTRTPADEFIYTISQSKTDQEGKGHVVPIKGRVAHALNEWLSRSRITEGKIFRTVKKGNHLGDGLSCTDVYRIVKRRLKKAGYDETQFGAHGLRSGFVTEAGRRGKPLGDVMQLTTHKNVATVMKYYQAGNIINNSASNLAD